MKKRILLIGSLDDVVQKAKDAGFYVVLFQEKCWLDDEKFKTADETFIFDWENYEYTFNIAKALHDINPFEAVISFGEKNILISAKIAKELNVQGNSIESVENTIDKIKMREILKLHDVPSVKYKDVTNLEEALEAIMDVNLPAIIKPSDGWASICVKKVNSKEELKLFFKENNFSHGSKFIIEEYIDGDEFSVEGITFEGNHKIAAITKKLTTGEPNFIESGHIIPPTGMPPIEKEKIIKYTKSVLDSIGHYMGPSHTEIKLSSRGPIVIETHTRPGGDSITNLVEISTGINIFEEFFRAIYNGKMNITNNSKEDRYSRIKFLLLNNGTIKNIEGLEHLKKLDFIYEVNIPIKPGDSIKKAKDNFSRHGYFIVKGNSEIELDTAYNIANETLKITLD